MDFVDSLGFVLSDATVKVKNGKTKIPLTGHVFIPMSKVTHTQFVLGKEE